MSFKLMTLLYWTFILTWVTCNAITANDAKVTTNKTTDTPVNVDTKVDTNTTSTTNKPDQTGDTNSTTSTATATATSAFVTVSQPNITTTTVTTNKPTTAVATSQPELNTSTVPTNKSTTDVTFAQRNVTTTIPITKPATDSPTKPTSPISPTVPGNVSELTLTSKEVTATSVTVIVTSRKNETLVVNITNGDTHKTVIFNVSANLPREHTFGNLQPYSKYIITALGSKLSITTLEAAPSKPQNLQVVQTSEHSVKIEWEKPAMLNGKVVQFRVGYTFDNSVSEKVVFVNVTNGRSYTITDLYAFVNYTINVQEKTVAYSPSASTSAKTSKAKPCKPPDGIKVVKQNPIRGEKYKYTVEVVVKWNPVPFYCRGDDNVSYTYWWQTKDKNRTKNTTRNTIINPKLEPYKHYKLKIATENNHGNSKEADFPFKTRQAPPSKPRYVQAEPIREKRRHTINVTWTEPEYPNGKPVKFKYVIDKCNNGRCKRESDSRSYPEGHTFDTPPKRYYIIEQMNYVRLDAYTDYSIMIAEATCDNCWGEMSEKKYVKTLAGVPMQPRNVVKGKVDASSMVIHWMPPFKANGIIESYQIVLKRDPSTVVKRVDVPSTGEKSYTYTFEDLDSQKGYSIEIRAISEEGTLGDVKLIVFQTLQSTTWLFILIGCLVVVLIIVLILSIYLLVSRRRRQYKEVKSNDDIEMRSGTKSKVIPLANFKNICLQQHANSDHGFQQEYETLRAPVRQFTWEHSAMSCNQVKNRYSNIVAYDHSRVILAAIEDDPSSAYINANYIDGYLREKQYIATQGPLPETVIDFWRMIWDENCPIIVMLTKLIEDNRLKCEQYWPEGKGMQYKDIVVTITSVKEMTDMTVKVFKLNKINNPELGTREVRHFHYTAWPDHGVPNHPTSMLSFIRHVMSYFPKELTAPIVVHCSAGVGRTGTFIAIEGCLRQMENDNQVDVFGTVLRMRMKRNFMVQTESQYTFIYDALLDNAVCGNTEISPENLVARIKYLNEQDTETGQAHFVAEFKRLESGFNLKEKEQFTDASHPENKAKNRFLNILPFDKNRIRLAPVPGSRQSDYINASIIDGFQQKHGFIATQAPLESTVVDFWRMVLEQNVQIIVMLTKTEEKGQEKCYLYWPQAGTVSYGSVHVDVVNVRNQDDIYIIHDLRITNRETGKSWAVTHFLYLGWPEYHGSPDSGTDLIHFIGLVEKTQRSITDGGPTLVHCSGGVGRTGVFITVFNSVERLKTKNVVDVFQTTRALRLQRSAMVQTIDQYKFCYQCLKDYLDSFDLYANPEC